MSCPIHALHHPKGDIQTFRGRRSLVFTAVGGLSWPRPGVCFWLSPIHFKGCVVVLFHKSWEPFLFLQNVLFQKESQELDGE